MDKNDRGYVHLYVGDGKGKTTAAMGLALRALGSGRSVLIYQLLKGGYSSELEPLKKLGATIMHAKESRKFIFQMTEEEKQAARESHKAKWAEARKMVMDGEADLAVFDEAVDAVNCGILDAEDLAALVREKPEQVEIVFTGRDPKPEILEISDYHTNFICVKHPYQKGVAARKGIEF